MDWNDLDVQRIAESTFRNHSMEVGSPFHAFWNSIRTQPIH